MHGRDLPVPRCSAVDGDELTCSRGWSNCVPTILRFVAWLRALATSCAQRGAPLVILGDPPDFRGDESVMNHRRKCEAMHQHRRRLRRSRWPLLCIWCPDAARARALRQCHAPACAQHVQRSLHPHLAAILRLICGKHAACGLARDAMDEETFSLVEFVQVDELRIRRRVRPINFLAVPARC